MALLAPTRIRRFAKAVEAKQYGDAVEIVAKPVAVVMDKVLGTNLVNCGSCAERRKKWNQTK